jgi:hypothetical protein
MHLFLPMRADIVLWEFAINDATYRQTNNETLRIMEAQNQLILWLRQVARVSKQRIQTKPPLFILVYLWSPHQFLGRHFSRNVAFNTNRGVAERYDFVVGHVCERWEIL